MQPKPACTRAHLRTLPRRTMSTDASTGECIMMLISMPTPWEGHKRRGKG